ncbi:MAG: hypothetical protein JSR62_13230 [Nitrospira sp.]|nr:hypothetical protein [Nitrospira sp.]
MRSSSWGVIRWVVLAEICVLSGCGNPVTELDLRTDDPRQDQGKIAALHAHEAARLKQKAQDQLHRATVYERLFGHDSDWVKGARLLAQSYTDAAEEQERTAERHQGVARDGRLSQTVRPAVP